MLLLNNIQNIVCKNSIKKWFFVKLVDKEPLDYTLSNLILHT